MPARRGERRAPAARPRTSSGRSCAGPRRRRGRGCAIAPRAPRSWASTRPSAPTCGGRRRGGGARRLRSARRAGVGVERAGGDDRLGGEAAGEQRLADALAGHHVAGHRRVAGEQHPAARPAAPGRCAPGSATPCAGPRASAAGPERARGRAGGRAVRPTAASCPGSGGCRRAARRSRCWPARRAAGTTRRSRGGGRRRTTRGGASRPVPVDAADVLAEGVPLAEVAGLGRGRAPCGPGSTSRRRRRRSGRRSGSWPSTPTTTWSARSAIVPSKPWPCEHGGAGLDGDVDERGVELEARGDGGEGARPRRQRHGDLASRRRAQHGAVDDLPVGDRRRVEAERLELAQGQRRQPVAAALVAREHRLVDDDDVAPGGGERDRRGDPGRPRPDDEHVRHRHGRTGYGQATAECVRHGVVRGGRHSDVDWQPYRRCLSCGA